MSINSANDIVSVLRNCNKLLEFLENDLKSQNEVGFCLGENGTVFAFREGEWDQVTVTLPPSDRDVDECRLIVHTHPSLDATGSGDLTVSDSDLNIGKHPSVCGLVILSQEMFDVN